MIGGCKVMLGLIAMARDTESLYMGVKSLVHTLRFNPSLRDDSFFKLLNIIVAATPLEVSMGT